MFHWGDDNLSAEVREGRQHCRCKLLSPRFCSAMKTMNQMNSGTGFPIDPAHNKAVLRGPVMPDLIRDETLAEIFIATAEAYPTKPAIVTREMRLTYADVLAEARAIARGLIQRGIGPGDVVGLWKPRGPQLLISQIGITLTGAAWLPFDGDAPVERINTCLADAEAKALLTTDIGRHEFTHAPCPVLSPADLVDRNDISEVPVRPAGISSKTPAYMIYTSGSTGVPKGIVISQGNITHFLRSSNEIYGIANDDVVFQGASVAFDLSMEEIWVPYLVGATLFVASPNDMGEAERLAGLMTDQGITVIDTVPTLLAILTEDVPSLRLILLGGEACPPTIVKKWSREGRRIFNTYGPTEATVVATAAIVVPDEPVTIGGPIPNYTCYVADENLNLLNFGQQGELLIGGPGVAQGYLKRDSLTAEKFIANPFGTEGNDPILYRSGDGVSLDPHGNILFHGRIDDQVKVRGFRVELGEIESRIQLLPGIAHAAVVLRRDNDLDQLVAFVIPAGTEGFDSREARKILRETMPAYMVPARLKASPPCRNCRPAR